MKTRITELFGIKHPIMLAGMNWITEPKLVAAVSNAGGLGILATAHLTAEEARKQIRETRELTDKPFGINEALFVPNSKEIIQVALEEKVPVINYSLGRPWFIDQVHAYGGKVIGTVALVRHAVRAQQLGCDAISVTGYEAAAHGADATSMVLIPLAANAVKVPLLAAGGFFDGRGLAAALALGADGIAMGTRFTVTKESVCHNNTKQFIMKATEMDTFYSDAFDGMPGRVLRSKGSEAMIKNSWLPLAGGISGVLHVKKLLNLSWGDVMRAAFGKKSDLGLNLPQQIRFAASSLKAEKSIYEGDNDHGFIYSGQAQGGVKDLPTVAELIDRIIAQAEEVLGKAREKYQIGK